MPYPRSSPRKRGPRITSTECFALGPRFRGDERRMYRFYFENSAIASSASTLPVIAIGANGALAATSAAVSMI